MDLFGLELAGVTSVVAFNFGGTHWESLSHLSLFLAAGLAGDFGALIHVEVSWDIDGPDGHCHELVGGAAAVVGVGVVVVVVIFLGLTTTLFGQDKFGGLFAR